MADGEHMTAELAKKRSLHVTEFEWDSGRIARRGVGLLIALAAVMYLLSAAPALGA